MGPWLPTAIFVGFRGCIWGHSLHLGGASIFMKSMSSEQPICRPMRIFLGKLFSYRNLSPKMIEIRKTAGGALHFWWVGCPNPLAVFGLARLIHGKLMTTNPTARLKGSQMKPRKKKQTFQQLQTPVGSGSDVSSFYLQRLIKGVVTDHHGLRDSDPCQRTAI